MPAWKQKDSEQQGLEASPKELLEVYTLALYTVRVNTVALYTVRHQLGILQPEHLGALIKPEKPRFI